MRRSQAQAIRPAVGRKPAAAQKATGPPRRAPASNHSLAGPAGDLASVVQQARVAPRAHVPHAGAVARDFGLSLSALEIHAGGAADAACRLLDARAFAVQNLVVFADPRPSLALVRHEFAHVVQQDGTLRPAPAQYLPGSLHLGTLGSQIERQADAAAAGQTDAAKRGAPVAVQRKGKDDTDDTPVTDAAQATERLLELAKKIALQTFQGAEDAKFGVSKDIKRAEPKFDPAFLTSSKDTWTIDDYMAANKVPDVATDKRRARYELSDQIFKRAPNGKLTQDAVARTAFSVNKRTLWASRAVPQDIAANTADLRTTYYAFLGTYRSKSSEIEPEKGASNPTEIVNERGRLKRGEADPVESLKSYIAIIKKLVTVANKAKKKLTDAKKVQDEIEGLIPDEDAKTGRDNLRDWVRAQYTDIDEFFGLVVQPEGFPENWSKIKGDIQEQFIADLAPDIAEAQQVYFGEQSSNKLKIKPSGKLKARRQGDGFIKVGDDYHILESKARTSAPSGDELEQMGDYVQIVTPPRVSGYLLDKGKISEKLGKFSAVEYYLAISQVPTDKNDPLYKLAEAWTTALYKAFKPGSSDKVAREKALAPKAPKPEGYLIHPNLSGDPAKFTTIQINPPIKLRIPNPDQLDQTVTDIPSKQAGAAIKRADFKLAQVREAEIASGSITISLDLGGALKSQGEPAPQPMRPVSREDAKPSKPGGPVIYGRVDNKFENLKSSLDDFFKNRVSVNANLTDDGVEGKLTVAPGASGIPGITIGAEVGVTYGTRGLTAKGHVDLSNEKGTIKSAITVTYNNSGKQWKVAGDVTFSDLIEGLEPIKAKFTYDPANDTKKIHADKVAIKRTYGGITLKGAATNLDFDINAGTFSGAANLAATLGAFGEASAENVTIEANQLKNATLAYKTPKLAYPKTNPALAGDLKGSITYTAGKTPDDKPTFSGEIEVYAQIHAAALKKLAKGGTLGVTGTVKISDQGKFSGSIGTTDALTLGQHFRIPPFHADVAEDGALSLDFSIEVVDIGPLKDAKVDALINDKGFSIKGANIQLKFGSDKDKVWGTLGVIYTPPNLTVGGTINVRIKEGLVAHGEAYHDTQKETVTATLSIDEITLLKYGPKDHTLVDFSKQVELVSFYKVIGIYLDVGFKLAFSYEFDLRLNPKVTLEDFSFKTFAFSRAKAVMRLLGEMVATLTGTPNIGLGLFVISTKLLRGGGGIEVPIVGRAALALEPPVTIEVVYTPEGGVSGGGTAGLTLLFGVTGSVKPYADFSVLDGTYEHKWHGEPLTQFELLKERPIFTYVVNFGKPLTTETKPPIPEGQDPPKQVSAERSITGKPQGQGTPTAVDTKKPAQEKDPEEKPKAENEGGFDLKGMVSRLLDEPSFASARRILDAAAEVWATISGIVSAIVNFVRNWIGGAIDLIVGAIKAIGKKNLIGYVKDLLKKRMHPIVFHIIEPLLDQLATVEQDLYDLFEIKLPTSPGEFLEFTVDIVKKVLLLAWDSLPGLVKALYKMIRKAIDATRDFAQYLVNEGKLGVTREERYIGIEGTRFEHDFLLANEYKIKFGGMNVHEKDDSAWPSVDKAIGWGLWHLLDELGVQPTNTAINRDTGEPYNDYWVERQVRGTGAVADR